MLRYRLFVLFIALAGLAIAALVVGCATPVQADTAALTKTLIDKEGQPWAAVKSKQPAIFKGLFTDDSLTVYPEGTLSLNESVQQISDPSFNLKEYALSDIKVIFPTKDTAVVTYKSTVKGDAGGQEFSGVYNVSSVWVNRNNNWLMVLHTEAKMP